MANSDGTVSDSTSKDEFGLPKADNEEIVSKLREIFGDETTKAFEAEELLNEEGIKDLMTRDADAPIFSRLGLKYGKAVRFKAEFAKIFPEQKIISGKKASPTNVKPRMEDIAFFSAEQKSTYLLKRRKVGVLASARWKGYVPKFNNPQMKAELASFASEIAPQCAMPEVGFNEEGIMKHVQAYFNEQRRYRRERSGSKRKCLSEYPKLPELHVPTAKSDSDEDLVVARKRVKTVQKASHAKDNYDETQSVMSDDGTLSTLSVDSSEHSVEEEDASTNKDNVPQLKRAVEQSATPAISLPLKGYQMIVKSVFGEQLNREDIVKVLKNRFLVKPNSLTTLTVSQLTEVVAKKLMNNRFCSIRQGANSSKMKMEDIIVHKGIAL